MKSNKVTLLKEQEVIEKSSAEENKLAEEVRLLNEQIQSLSEKVHEMERELGWEHFTIKRLKRFVASRLNLKSLHAPTKPIFPPHYMKKIKLTKTPKLSIVTPSYNQGDYIEATIESIISQDYPNLEYIVQDGGSKDSTVNVLKNHDEEILHWESKQDKGQTNAINLGFQHASGEIMAYLNSDDLLLPGALNYIVNYFNEHPEVDVIYGHRILIDSQGEEVGRWVLPRHDDKVLSFADFIPQETLFWRRSIWEKVGGSLDESFRFAMDWDLIVRFRDAGAKFVRLPRFLGAFRVHQLQKSSALINDLGEKEMTIIRQRCAGRRLFRSEINKAVKNYLLKHVICQKLYRFKLLRY
jgi:carbamoyltransferase